MYLYVQLALLGMSLFGEALANDGCPMPAIIAHGDFEPKLAIYPYKSVVRYQCDEGFELVGVQNRTCESLRQISAYWWEGGTPECRAVQCPVPKIDNATILDVAQPSDFFTNVTYLCRSGFVPLGQQTATCKSDGSWQYVPCLRPEFLCGTAPPAAQYATHNATDLYSYPSGTRVAYKCNSGYKSAKNGLMTCVKTSWVGSTPECELDEIMQTTTERMDETPLGIELPIISGVLTACFLTLILIILVCCLRRRKILHFTTPKKPDSIASSTAVSSSTSPSDLNVTPNQSFRLPRPVITSVSTQQSVFSACGNNSRPVTPVSNARMMTGPLPLIPASIATPSMTETCTTPSEAEFHTIRECLGEFKNNNHSMHRLPGSSMGWEAPGAHNSKCGHKTPTAYPYHQTFLLDRASCTSTPRPDHYPCSQHYACGHHPTLPYETVTCPHGVEHVYQPLEHVYEEPRIWMRPLPNPTQHQYHIV